MDKKEIGCRYFIGEKPCKFKIACEPARCKHYAGFGKRILIIKLAAIGDVLRTTPILQELKKRYPSSHITWLTSQPSKDLLRNNPYIDRVYVLAQADILRLSVEKFDLLISLDKDPAAIALAVLAHATKKIGFKLSKDGNLAIFDSGSLYAYILGFDDELKFRKNKKTYQRIMFDMCGYKGRYGEYIFKRSSEDEKYASDAFRKWGIKKTDRVVGLNTGAGRVFTTKKWDKDHFVKLAKYLKQKAGVKVLLLGGPDEKDTNKYIAAKVRGAVIDTGTGHTVTQFASIVSKCDLLVASDTLAMHLAIAARVPVVVLIGSTSPDELDLYGRGAILYKGISCSPCYRGVCSDAVCMSSITPEEVFKACKKLL